MPCQTSPTLAHPLCPLRLVPENPYTLFYPGPPATRLLTPTRHSTHSPSAKESLWASAALQHFLPMVTIPTCTPEDTLQHPPTPPTFPPLTTMHTWFLLQLQFFQSTQIIILPLICHSPLKFPLPPDSKGSKPTTNSATRSSASSASLLQSLQDALAPSLST
ncbi:hypothetical protein E4T56_gene4667 [Termitomyces sp. T112]|nr:hypothetical protein E4T56_gene4667 [Termitomyces sp. T112]